MHPMCEADEPKAALSRFPSPPSRLGTVKQPELDVLGRRSVGQQVVLLEHEPEL
jgi:hypothetical protein